VRRRKDPRVEPAAPRHPAGAWTGEDVQGDERGQKVGIEMPPSDTTRQQWSARWLRRDPEITPSVIQQVAMRIDRDGSSAVAGTNSARSARTERSLCSDWRGPVDQVLEIDHD